MTCWWSTAASRLGRTVITCNFLAYRDTITPHLIDGANIGEYNDFNGRVGRAGLLQLTTQTRTAVHIGNLVDESVRRIYADWYGKDLV